MGGLRLQGVPSGEDCPLKLEAQGTASTQDLERASSRCLLTLGQGWPNKSRAVCMAWRGGDLGSFPGEELPKVFSLFSRDNPNPCSSSPPPFIGVMKPRCGARCRVSSLSSPHSSQAWEPTPWALSPQSGQEPSCYWLLKQMSQI